MEYKKMNLLFAPIIASLIVGNIVPLQTNFKTCEDLHNTTTQNANFNIAAREIKPRNEILDYNSALATSEQTYDTFLEAYFRGLTKNMGENYKGSCGYVAIGQLLSYYDTYLSDSIIEEKYDVSCYGNSYDMVSQKNSPGILNDTISVAECSKYGVNSVSKLNANDYYKIISTKSNTSLHAKLITIGEGLGYYRYNNDTYPCETNYIQQEDILRKYLSEIGLPDDCYSIYCVTGSSDEVKDCIRSSINLGYPVLTTVYNSETYSGHAMICYDYDNNNIYGNLGWSGNQSYAHYAVESKFDTYQSALTIRFYFKHEHSLNYRATINGITQDYCYCNCDILTYKYVPHSYTDYYIDNENGTTHNAYCRCGRFKTESHTWFNKQLLSIKLEGYCKKCYALRP